jgi:LemA protein
MRGIPVPETQRRGFGPALIAVVVVALVAVGAAGWVGSSYNRLVRLDQGVEAQWAQVQNAYQRRADLIPNLVATVKGAANFEQSTLVQVTQARAQIMQPPGAAPSPAQLEQFQRQQDQLSGALSRLMVVVERYPELKATAAFRDLQAQLEGTENRIAIERMRFNEASQRFNTERNTFPTNFAAGLFGNRFSEKAYFQAREGSDRPPPVQF